MKVSLFTAIAPFFVILLFVHDASAASAKILWIEPQALDNAFKQDLVTKLYRRPTAVELRAQIQRWKAVGFSTFVIAYAEYNNKFVYRPKSEYTFKSTVKCAATGAFNVNSMKSHCAGELEPLLSGGDNFMDVFMSEAEAVGAKVYVGLSKGGDEEFLSDLENSLASKQSGSAKQALDRTMQSRLVNVMEANVNLANDLWAQYKSNKSFAGWYLAHETACLDVGENLYLPLAKYLRQLSRKRVLISPLINGRVCYNAASYDQQLAKYKGAVTDFAYQDAFGAGTIYVTGEASAKLETYPLGASIYTYSDQQRTVRLNAAAYKKRLAELAAAHKKAGSTFWVNVEAWRMKGNCPATTTGYGCAYPGRASFVQKQIDLAATYTPNIMLNEGFLLFDFGMPIMSSVKNYSGTSGGDAALARRFTADYKSQNGIPDQAAQVVVR